MAEDNVVKWEKVFTMAAFHVQVVREQLKSIGDGGA
jgi:hypothetical protein